MGRLFSYKVENSVPFLTLEATRMSVILGALATVRDVVVDVIYLLEFFVLAITCFLATELATAIYSFLYLDIFGSELTPSIRYPMDSFGEAFITSS